MTNIVSFSSELSWIIQHFFDHTEFFHCGLNILRQNTDMATLRNTTYDIYTTVKVLNIDIHQHSKETGWEMFIDQTNKKVWTVLK